MEEKKLQIDARGQPVSRVHVDYTTRSGVERLHTLLPDEAEKLQKTPFAVIQVFQEFVVVALIAGLWSRHRLVAHICCMPSDLCSNYICGPALHNCSYGRKLTVVLSCPVVQVPVWVRGTLVIESEYCKDADILDSGLAAVARTS